MRSRIIVVLCVALAHAQPILAVEKDSTSQSLSGNDRAILGAIMGIAVENDAKFPHGLCRFRHQDGYTATLDDARAGRLDRLAEGTGSYLFEGNHGKYERVFPFNVLVANTTWVDANHLSSRLACCRVATNGKATIEENISAGRDGKTPVYGRGIYAGRNSFDSSLVFPIMLGCPVESRGDFIGGIRMMLAGSTQLKLVRLDPNAVREGRSLVQVIIARDKNLWEDWIDLERGGIAVYHKSTNYSGSWTEVFQDDIRLVPGHGWLPYTHTSRFSDQGRTWRTIVEQAEFDKPLPPGAFKLTLSEPDFLPDPITGVAYPKPQKVWDLDNLPSVGPSRPMATPRPKSKAEAGRPAAILPPMLGELTAPRYPMTTIFLVGAGVVAFGGAIVGRMRRGGDRGSVPSR